MMYRRFRSYTKRIKVEVRNFIVNLKKKSGIYIELPIVDLSEIGDKVCLFKEETLEHFDFIKTFGFIKSGGYDLLYPEIAVWRINNAKVFSSSDFVVSSDEYIAWPKYFFYNYSKNIATDSFLICEKNGLLTYKKPNNLLEVDTAFSMIGVFSHIWAHAIVEYFPKLSILDKVIADSPKKVTVLIPEYKDEQLRYIMLNQLKKYNVDILVVKDNQSVKCTTLYYMPRPTIFTDHETEITPGDQVLPRAVVDVIKRDIVDPYTSNLLLDEKYRKIFLPRRGGLGKGIINQEEVENIFRERGFFFVEPHKVSFEEKVRIFQSADIIVGPFGSAFSNLIFCKPGTKVMMFSNYQRVFDYYFGTGQQYFGEDLLYVTGYDDKNAPNMSHCSYYLPLEKVLEASKTFGIIDD